ncbi:MAG: ABC transporter permease [Pseudomonadota bacterium]|uniref:ABC transporter permease n=1 Tax=Thalassococcus sp. TaxID=1928858 RepID=UPI001B0AAEB5|nr:ABC transporter permease [Thalassococcus sp.]MBO6867190.1 ABC transporter permease [Thalassococcus sp.]MEC8579975.1 ABC transporter permease [Pseudomonadota bacterium]
MFEKNVPTTKFGSALNILELTYLNAVQSVRSKHGNAFMALFTNILQSVIFTLAFFMFFQLLGMRAAAIRGDFMVYIMSGIFLFMTHTKSVAAVAGAEGPTSGMMLHAPMNTAISIMSRMLSTLYIQVSSLLLILFFYDMLFAPGVIGQIHNPIQAFGMLLLAWLSGGAVGLVFLAASPWYPTPVGVLRTIYQRANMIASGKMFVANSLTPQMLALFDWNPLFHTIDQARGYAFINYFPRNSSWEYALWFTLIFMMIGLMGEFFTRKHVSASWFARR